MTIDVEKPENLDLYHRSVEVGSGWILAMSSLFTVPAGKRWELSLDGKEIIGIVSSLPSEQGGDWTNEQFHERSFPVFGTEIRVTHVHGIRLHGH